MIGQYFISSDILKSIHICSMEDRDLLLKYTRGLMFGSQTPELRSYWTLVNMWVGKHFITKHFTEEEYEGVS